MKRPTAKSTVLALIPEHPFLSTIICLYSGLSRAFPLGFALGEGGALLLLNISFHYSYLVYSLLPVWHLSCATYTSRPIRFTLGQNLKTPVADTSPVNQPYFRMCVRKICLSRYLVAIVET